jgi:hypothetical protein
MNQNIATGEPWHVISERRLRMRFRIRGPELFFRYQARGQNVAIPTAKTLQHSIAQTTKQLNNSSLPAHHSFLFPGFALAPGYVVATTLEPWMTLRPMSHVMATLSQSSPTLRMYAYTTRVHLTNTGLAANDASEKSLRTS